MAIIVSDQFTEASDTLLTAHVPNTTGTGWVEVAINGTSHLQVKGSTDELGVDAAGTNQGQFCKSQPAPAVVDYDVELKINAVDTTSNSRPWRIHGRQTDGDNGFYIEFATLAHANNDTSLFKIVAGTRTSLASVDTGLANADVIKLELRDATKKVYKNAVEILSTTDNTFAGPGDAGISSGKPTLNYVGSAASGVWRFDNYVVTEVAGAAPKSLMPFRRPWRVIQQRG